MTMASATPSSARSRPRSASGPAQVSVAGIARLSARSSRLDRVIETRTGHSRGSRSRLDIVPRPFERLHDCLRLSDRNKGVHAQSTLADVLREGASDYSSNRCLLSTNGHGVSHNVKDHDDGEIADRPVAKFLLPISSILCYTTIMSKSVNVARKKRGRPATGKDPDPFLTARVPQDTIDAIERWAADGKISRSEAIRRLLKLGLERVPAQRGR
jgi:Ribbon-helix-helix protein, copG family